MKKSIRILIKVIGILSILSGVNAYLTGGQIYFIGFATFIGITLLGSVLIGTKYKK